MREDRDKNWGETENYTGRVVLLPKGLASVEMQKHDRAGQVASTERLVWMTEEFHQFRPEHKKHIIWPIAEPDRGRVPAVLALPFFWHLSVEGLKSRFRIELLEEKPETWVFRIKPLSDIGRQSLSTAFLSLDRSTFLPRQYCLISPDGKSTKSFRVTEVRSPRSAPADLLAIPEDGDWTIQRGVENQIMGWLVSLFKPDLLPNGQPVVARPIRRVALSLSRPRAESG